MAVWSGQDRYSELQQPVRLYEFSSTPIHDMKMDESEEEQTYEERWQEPNIEVFFPRIKRSALGHIGTHGVQYVWPQAAWIRSCGSQHLLFACALSLVNEWDDEALWSERGAIVEGCLDVNPVVQYLQSHWPNTHEIDRQVIVTRPSNFVELEAGLSYPYAGGMQPNDNRAVFTDHTSSFAGRTIRFARREQNNSGRPFELVMRDYNHRRKAWDAYDGERTMGALRDHIPPTFEKSVSFT